MPGFLADVLTRPQNGGWLDAVQTAKAWGITPLEQLCIEPGVLDEATTRSVNAKLRQALEIIERETCATCGHPAWLGHSADSSIQFTTRTIRCYACAAVEDAEEADQKAKRKKRTGAVRVAELVRTKSFEQPSRRDWLKQEEKEAVLRQARLEEQHGMIEE